MPNCFGDSNLGFSHSVPHSKSQFGPGISAGIRLPQHVAFVTDPPGDTDVLPTTTYPTTGNGVTFGWVNTYFVQGRDRNAKLDPRLAGINFANNGVACNVLCGSAIGWYL